MSELEKEELVNRITAMTVEEKIMVCSLLPTDILVEEIKTRLLMQEQRLSNIVSALM